MIITVAIVLMAAHVSAWENCSPDYVKMGCFVEGQTKMELIQDSRQDLNYRGLIDWNNLEDSIHHVTCLCSQQAKDRNAPYFSIRFWGECWIGEDMADLNAILQSDDKYSSKCHSTSAKEVCNDEDEKECAGEEYIEYMYRVSNLYKPEPLCEGVHDIMTLSCPISGQEISIIHANYGRRDTEVCKRSDGESTSCVSPTSLQKTEQLCDGLKECTLKADNSIYGDPCRGVHKYLEVTYRCVESRGETTIICEHDEKDLSCPQDDQQIHIIRANYGRRTTDLCPVGSHDKTDCVSNRGLEDSVAICNGLNSCRLKANNGVYGDTCWWVRKYLEVTHICINSADVIRPQPVCEHGTMELSCPPSKVISIVHANYGRRSTSICPSGGDSCHDKNSFKKAKEVCNGFHKCSLKADNGVFGDHCWFQRKYLELSYHCVE